jgi:hypothetical protein
VEEIMKDQTIPGRASACADRCIGDVCATAGTNMGCGGCCACLQRCQVRSVEDQLRHPLLSAAAEERVRVLEQEGRTHDHDDEHGSAELGAAAAAYALSSWDATTARAFWPWARELFNPGPDRKRELVKAAQLLMAEWDRLERDRLHDEARQRPVLVPRELCDSDQEVWWEDGSGCFLELRPGAGGSSGHWTARVYFDGPGLPELLPVQGDTQRRAVAVALRQVLDAEDADRLAMEFPDDMPAASKLGEVEVLMHALLAEGRIMEHVATVVMDGVPVTSANGSTAQGAKQQALLNAGIAMLQEGAGIVVATSPPQAPSRGWHPDQAVVEEITQGGQE